MADENRSQVEIRRELREGKRKAKAAAAAKVKPARKRRSPAK